MAEHFGGVQTGESSDRKLTVPPPRPIATEFLRSSDKHSTGDEMKLFSAAFPYDYSLARVRVKRGVWWMIPLRRNVDSGNMEFEGPLWKLFTDHYKIKRTFTLSVIYEVYHNFQIKVYDNHCVRVQYYKDDFRCACYGSCDVDDAPTDQSFCGFEKRRANEHNTSQGQSQIEVADAVAAVNEVYTDLNVDVGGKEEEVDNVTQTSAGCDKEKEEAKGGNRIFRLFVFPNVNVNKFQWLNMKGANLVKNLVPRDVQLKEGDTFHHPTADIAPPPAWLSFNMAYFRTSHTNRSLVFVARGEDVQRLKQMPTGPWMVSFAGAEFHMEVLSNIKQNRNFGSGWKEIIDKNAVEKGSLNEMRVPNAWQHVMEANITRH